MTIQGPSFPVAPPPRVVKPLPPETQGVGGKLPHPDARPPLSESAVRDRVDSYQPDVITLAHEMATPGVGGANFQGLVDMMHARTQEHHKSVQQLQNFESTRQNQNSSTHSQPPQNSSTESQRPTP